MIKKSANPWKEKNSWVYILFILVLLRYHYKLTSNIFSAYNSQVRTNGTKLPTDAVNESLGELKAEIADLSTQFQNQASLFVPIE